MNNLIFYIILLLGNLASLSNISERNQLKREAATAYDKHEYKKALILYNRLAESTYIVAPEVRLNLAHSYFMTHDTTNAKIHYQRLLRVHNNTTSSVALTQLGIITAQNGDSVKALTLFKDALHKNIDNSVARTNYELIRRKLPPNKLPPPPKQDKQQKEQTATAGSIAQSDEKKELLKKNPPENISREKALQILDAMKSNEAQANDMPKIQQKKATNASKKYDKDW